MKNLLFIGSAVLLLFGACAGYAQDPIEWDSSDPKTYYDLGKGLMRMREYASALEAFRSAYEKDSGYVDALFAQGEALERLERYDEMTEVYQRVLRHKRATPRQHAEAHCAMGTRAFKEERWEPAQQHFASAVEVDDSHARSWYLLGRCHERAYRWEKAADAYGKAVDHAPENRGYEKALDRALDALMWGGE
ncbi:tetratricopeptide repeat protein [bacterium]|nr:tetratricopeptide repeat protein [bacterium]